jgi:hypothetical protein
MNTKHSIRLGSTDIIALSSPYLAGGRKLESWRIDEVTIDNKKLTAMVSMRSVYLSGTDSHGFHLSCITALEFVSQLQIIFMHVWAGIQKKTQEVWMIETNIKTIHPILNQDKINIEMQCEKIRKTGDKYYCTAHHKITDNQGGLFEIWIKALMS